MKMLSLFAVTAGFTLLGASPPPMDYGARAGGPGGYPPCSAEIQDRCIQLHERGVASRHNLALNERLGPDRMPRRYARMGGMRGPMRPMGEPPRMALARNDYPRCGPGIEDRCIQAPAPGPAAAPVTRSYRTYARQMVRLGERG